MCSNWMYLNKKIIFLIILITPFLSLLLNVIYNIDNVFAKKHNLYPHILSSQSIGQTQSLNQNLKCGSVGNILPGSCTNNSIQNQIDIGSNNGH